MKTKSDKPKKDTGEQTLNVLRCAACKKQVAYHLKDCPWCGSSLAYGWLEKS